MKYFTSSQLIQQQQQQQSKQKQIPSTISNNLNEFYHNKQQQQLSKSLLELSNKGYVNEKDICKLFSQEKKNEKQLNESLNSYSMRDLAVLKATNINSSGSGQIKSAFLKPNQRLDDVKLYRNSLSLIIENNNNNNNNNSTNNTTSSSNNDGLLVDDIDIMVDVNVKCCCEVDTEKTSIRIDVDEDDGEDSACFSYHRNCYADDPFDEYDERSTYSLVSPKVNQNHIKKKSISSENLNVNETQPPPHIQPLSGVLSKSLMSVVLKPHPVKPTIDTSKQIDVSRKLQTLPSHFHSPTTNSQMSKNNVTNPKCASTNNLNLSSSNFKLFSTSIPQTQTELKSIKEKSEKKPLFKKNSTSTISTSLSKDSNEQTPKRSKFLELKNFFSSSSSASSSSKHVPLKNSKSDSNANSNSLKTINRSVDVSINNEQMKNEILKLKNQLNYEIHNSNNLKFQLNELNLKQKQKQLVNTTTQTINYDNYNVHKLNDELNNLKCQIDNERKKFENEKEKWLCEKEKVLKFQKYLQFNYMQVLKQNKYLQTQLDSMVCDNRSVETLKQQQNQILNNNKNFYVASIKQQLDHQGHQFI